MNLIIGSVCLDGQTPHGYVLGKRVYSLTCKHCKQKVCSRLFMGNRVIQFGTCSKQRPMQSQIGESGKYSDDQAKLTSTQCLDPRRLFFCHRNNSTSKISLRFKQKLYWLYKMCVPFASDSYLFCHYILSYILQKNILQHGLLF